MSFIPSGFRVLTGAIVLVAASVFLNLSGDTDSLEAMLAMGAQAKEKCIKVDGKRVCFEEGGKKNKNKDDDDDDDDNEKAKAKSEPFTCKKARCEPGMVVLDKPNKYGACCEAREGLPPKKAAEPEKCKFPGEVGTPPNCTCPPHKEFMGYKGCVVKYWTCKGMVKALGPGSWTMPASNDAEARTYVMGELQAQNRTLDGPLTCGRN